MPKRRPSDGEPGKYSGPTMLTLRRADLAKILDARIGIGSELLTGKLTSLARKDQYYKWHRYNTTLLRNSFTTTEEVDKYQSILIDWSGYQGATESQIIQDLRDSLRRLESIRERLPLFEQVAVVTTTTRETQDDSRHSDTKPAIFLVHGRDEGTKHGVARYVRAITGLEPIILAEQPALGQTVIESFERYASQVTYAVVLATGDDEGRLLVVLR